MDETRGSQLVEVKVLDNLFTDKFLIDCYADVAFDSKWTHSTTNTRYQYPSDCQFVEAECRIMGTTWYRPITKHFYDNTMHEHLMYVYEVILKEFSEELKKSKLNIVQGNLQLIGMDGYPHQDVKYDTEGEKTVMFFPHYKWEKEWGGEFQVLSDDGTQVKESYLPLPGRLMLFSNHILHQGLAPRVPKIPRYSVVYRFI